MSCSGRVEASNEPLASPSGAHQGVWTGLLAVSAALRATISWEIPPGGGSLRDLPDGPGGRTDAVLPGHAGSACGVPAAGCGARMRATEVDIVSIAPGGRQRSAREPSFRRGLNDAMHRAHPESTFGAAKGTGSQRAGPFGGRHDKGGRHGSLHVVRCYMALMGHVPRNRAMLRVVSLALRLAGPREVIRWGSSLKICAVAEGTADLYPRFGPTWLWDTAAGVAIAEEAGCVVVGLGGESLSCDPAVAMKQHPGFIVNRAKMPSPDGPGPPPSIGPCANDG